MSATSAVVDAHANANTGVDGGISIDQAATIGDGSNDIPMLAAAGMGCGYRGKPKVKAATGCQLNYADLTCLLFYMGYRRSEFVA